MIKWRLLPFLATVAVSAALLFGGWYAYQQTAVERPLSKAVQALPGVSSAQPSLSQDVVTVKLTLNGGADLRTIYEQISRQGASVIGSRKLVLQVDGPTSPKLEEIWSSQLFTIAEAMENREYSRIPDALAAMQKSHEGLRAKSSMDQANVYVTLEYGTDTKYVIMPRAGETMGVWPNA
ncbi:hypothetical protein [Paenibacillus sp. B01]|uniref:hypothetical protein n=1 Tax=Paenibacillus sp. B01 TaxID=2660554 RepID=UPI00129A32F4|nr:hypothetical protein [Paenibacillus sp. B01]QGG56138.1 hypothetical protein GE073_11490 [Paenibacillus sp. B01]